MGQRQWILLGFIIVLALVALWIDQPNHSGINLQLGPLKFQREVKVYRGLDLQGGLQVLLQAKMPDGAVPDPDALEAARTIIENRVNSLGVSEPLIQIQGNDKIVVELPGIKDPDQAIRTFGQTGLLEFIDAGQDFLRPREGDIPGETVETTYPLLYSEYIQTPTPTPTLTPEPTATPAVTTGVTETEGITATAGVTGTGALTGTAGAAAPAQPQPQPTPRKKYVTVITGQHLRTAAVSFDQTTGAPEVAFELTAEGSKRFYEYTSNNIGSILAIVLDKEVISSPRVQSAISDRGRITGNFTLDQARSLVIQLKYGALPVPLEVVENRTVGPTLGEDSVAKSIRAGIIGLTVVVLFMLIYYRLPGLLADLALTVYALVVFALFKLIPVVLTLAGIAGFILSVGMAVDANILIFERMKEELRAGKRLRAAVDAGFSRAWPSIRDSNMSTLITCGILWWFGGQFGATIVKGFALTLAIGVLVSLFTAITVTRTLLHVTQLILFKDEEPEDEPRLRRLLGY